MHLTSAFLFFGFRMACGQGMKTDICFSSCLLKSSSFSFVHAIIVCILKNNGSIKIQEIVSMPEVRSEKVLF